MTLEILTANEALKGLDATLLNEIVEVSNRTQQAAIESAVNKAISDKTKEIYDRIDLDIKEATGLEKPSNVKTYNFLKSAIEQIKTAPNAANEQVINDLRSQVSALQSDLTVEKANGAANLQKYQLDTLLSTAKKGIELKPEYKVDGVESVLYEKALNSVLSIAKPDFSDPKNVVFRGVDGQILLDAADGQRPLKFETMLRRELAPLLAEAAPAKGAGGKAQSPTDSSVVLDLSGVINQVQANERISAFLASMGISTRDVRYYKEYAKIAKDNNINTLPLK